MLGEWIVFDMANGCFLIVEMLVGFNYSVQEMVELPLSCILFLNFLRFV